MFFRRFSFLAVLAAALVLSTGCAVPQRQKSQAYHARSDGTVSTATRSALNGSTDAGPQELIGVYIPFIGTGLAIKAGLEFDPAGGGVITIPIGGQSDIPTPPAYMPQAGCTTTRTVMVPETFYEDVTTVQRVPRTRMVPRTEVVPSLSVPIPARPQVVPGCVPPPTPPVAAGELPPPRPATEQVCTDAESCGNVPFAAASK